ncbi:uncharacterized protein LOC120632064 isoform X2 [Pararge aegeria]|uniref:uncharacterized protein LOC120632064 isoform X2 n=1 Tax=Pararge aegeria TaxID=116150 RepID=UPI0019D1F917|nr:uncharacterized protein LOC120632064 isoform X2 [Pararge aegeria]
MSGTAQEGDGGTAETGASTTVQDLYREKPVSTVVRVLTVLAYLFSVSFAAILLSIYYICVWRSPVIAKLTDNRDMLSARRGDPSDYGPDYITHDSPHNFTGGSDTSVNETATPPTLENIANFTNSNETAETIADYTENSTFVASEKDYTSDDNETLNVTTIT